MKSKFLKEYFSFSKRERNGMIVLFILLFVMIIIRVILNNGDSTSEVNFNKFENDIDVFLSYAAPDLENGVRFNFDPNSATKEDFLKMGLSMKTVNGILTFREKGWKFYKPEDLEKVWEILPEEYEAIKDYIKIQSTSNYSKGKYEKKSYDKHKKANLFNFDPNTADKSDFEALGLKSWQADNIIKYRGKGGVFRTSEDFAKFRGLDQETVAELKPYIEIAEEYSSSTPTTVKSSTIILSLNSSTEEELQKLSGIGPYYAKSIVEYRNRLGGYLNVDQLMEVYGMTEESFVKISGNFTVDLNDIKKININTAKYADLVYHPYISKENAKNIINYRTFAGKIKSFEELLKQKAIDQEFYDKISPYIKTE